MSLVVGGVGGAQTFSSASGGKVYGFNNISEVAPITVAPANTARQKITFHNPGPNDLLIGPAFINNVLGSTPTSNAQVAFAPTDALYGGCWRVYGNGGVLEITGECQGAWQALAVDGASTANPLTVMDSNL